MYKSENQLTNVKINMICWMFVNWTYLYSRPDKTVRTVFWSLFGRGDATIVELDEFEHIFTQYVGYWIFGAYNWCSVIVLLNMLIAMMSRSFELIQVMTLFVCFLKYELARRNNFHLATLNFRIGMSFLGVGFKRTHNIPFPIVILQVFRN